MKQLQLCWNMYPDDYDARLLRNAPSGAASWVTGDMKIAASATNLADIENGLLFPYDKSPYIYKCPSAEGRTPSGLDGSLLVRTVSITPRMGNPDKDGLIAPAPPVLKLSEITNPAPSNAVVFVDESLATVDTGFFAMDNVAKQMAYRNSPTLRHGGGAVTVTFADGHANSLTFPSETLEPFPRTVLPSQSNDWRQFYVSIYPPPP
jgi:prepilin-type processing-associated H-X9-DG protein